MLTHWCKLQDQGRVRQAPATPDMVQPPSLRRLLRLSWRHRVWRRWQRGDLKWLWQIFRLIVRVEWNQRRLPLPALLERFEPKPGDAPLQEKELKRAERLTLAVLRRLYGRDFCMKQALLLYHFYRRAGVPVCIRFGVARENGQLRGHAWVEWNNQPIAEAVNPRQQFAITYTHPSGK
ncbi:lasso peptide biosynthesis B2 protein [Rhodothermus profundi]|uniref:Transglutaminase-like superfamily protein n=1 Tax=Rhodothermus profundi TaxID=633813 RepID=A0A1M6PXF0_9BACT|nr:lasso peptide biosynthesis B2 protein [Rhodothermus profundi]SHK12598.1 Transglutaminase-like superfamily protein [Rhodothermus profundi]